MFIENTPHRPSLSFEDAVQVWLLKWQGLLQSTIAQTMKTNQGRVNEILKERKHLGSKVRALELKG